MLIVFTKHSIIKLEQRKINKQLIFKTIRNPELIRVGNSSKEELYRKFNKNYLKVVVKKEKESILVITAHWVAKIKNKL